MKLPAKGWFLIESMSLKITLELVSMLNYKIGAAMVKIVWIVPKFSFITELRASFKFFNQASWTSYDKPPSIKCWTIGVSLS
jgi:hypothetical protein